MSCPDSCSDDATASAPVLPNLNPNPKPVTPNPDPNSVTLTP